MIEKTIEGEWWLPDTPDNHINGILTLHRENKFFLSLKGCLDPNFDNHQICFIHGMSKDGQSITLFKCLCDRIEMIRKQESSFLVYAVFINACYFKECEIAFDSFDVVYHFLEYWFPRGIQVKRKNIQRY